jgi:hypothetical protein
MISNQIGFLIVNSLLHITSVAVSIDKLQFGPNAFEGFDCQETKQQEPYACCASMGFPAGRNEVNDFPCKQLINTVDRQRLSSLEAVQFRHVEVVNKRVAGANAPFDLKGTAHKPFPHLFIRQHFPSDSGTLSLLSTAQH